MKKLIKKFLYKPNLERVTGMDLIGIFTFISFFCIILLLSTGFFYDDAYIIYRDGKNIIVEKPCEAVLEFSSEEACLDAFFMFFEIEDCYLSCDPVCGTCKYKVRLRDPISKKCKISKKDCKKIRQY